MSEENVKKYNKSFYYRKKYKKAFKNGYNKEGAKPDQYVDIQVGNKWKKMLIILKDSTHAELLMKLRSDNFRQVPFFEKIIKAYLEDLPSMRRLVEDISELPGAQKKRREKDFQEKQTTIKDYGLDENDIESIFDDIKNTDGDL